ncbi:MAG: ThuA domain-containing protein [Planctomycetales bacterium]|nr:ThuA domain-containing protein [Planctomycetales bacterium]
MAFLNSKRHLLWLIVLFILRPAAHADQTKVLIVVGPSNHPAGTHEVAAGGRLLEYCLERAAGLPNISAQVIDGWPKDKRILQDVATVVFSGDRFPLAEMSDTQQNMSELAELMDRGCGLVCFHYATGLTAGQMPDSGEHPLLQWMGGYFATRCVHHQSVARIFQSAEIELAAPDHPVLRGCNPFTIHDEPYINNYFGPDGIQPNVTPLLTSMLPPEAPKREVIAWAAERAEGGRGMGIVMPHFYKNWQVDDLRMIILNGIAWTAHLEVPEDGVQIDLPDLRSFAPEAVEFTPRAK